MNYKGCQACMHCKNHIRCKLEDDLTKVMKAIEEADAVVLGAPIYMMQYSGQFKLFEDRLYQFLGTGSRRSSEGYDFKISLKPGRRRSLSPPRGILTRRCSRA